MGTEIWVGLIIGLSGTFAALFRRSAIRYSKLMKAADRDDLEKFKKLLYRKKVNINGYGANGNRPLHIAAGKWAKEGLIPDILARGGVVDIRNVYKQTPLHFAVSHSKPDAVSKLIENGADVYARDANGHTPLSMALNIKNKVVIKLLLDAGAEPL